MSEKQWKYSKKELYDAATAILKGKENPVVDRLKADRLADALTMDVEGAARSATPPAWAKVTPREIASWRAFCGFWRHYPRKVGKPQAWATWKKLKLGAITGSDVARFAMHDPELETREVRFIPHPSTWLNRRGWEDADLSPAEALPFEQEQVPDRERRIRARTREIMEREYLGHPSARRKAIREVDGEV